MALLLMAFVGLAGCGTTPKSGVIPPLDTNSGSMARVGDFLYVSFTDLPAIAGGQFRDQKIRISDDGMITLPYNVRVQAAGRPFSEVEADARARYVPAYFQQFTIIIKPEERFYYVGGEVRIPGLRPYFGNMTVLRAIDTAGGFTDFAKRSHIEVRRENGKTELVNWKKARKDSKLDLPIFPNDHIIVTKGW